MKPIAIFSTFAVVLFCTAAGAQQTPASPAPEVKSVTLGPTREIKLADNTWMRFGFQVQAWFKAAQDRIIQPDGSNGEYALDFSCRRCRLFVTGSLVKDVNFTLLFEATPGRADPVSGVKASATPSLLDAFAQVKFADAFYLSGGSILMPLTRNGLQSTTTYLSIDNANIDITPVLQGNSNVLRDLGFQANGFFLSDHLEYRVGLFQGTRAPGTLLKSAGHNAPRLVTMLSANFWDTEKGYVNGGHYYGTKKVLGVMANFDYQQLRKADPILADGTGVGVSKDPYVGLSAATFINYPLSGTADPKRGGDELVGLLQVGYYNGGGTIDRSNLGTYPAVLKQINFLAEGAYYNRDLKISIFGKFEMRKIDSGYIDPIKGASNQMWFAGGVKYYVAPANLLNFGLQYERAQFPDAPSTAQSGTNNITFQMQMLLY